ncbi:MAG: hypothetical protein ACOCQR_03490 [bacterium]
MLSSFSLKHNKEKRLFKLTHLYSSKNSRIWIQGGTDCQTLDELCAFIQFFISRRIDESWGLIEDEMAEILVDLYGFQKINKSEIDEEKIKDEMDESDYLIDLFFNWENHCGQDFYKVAFNSKYYHHGLEKKAWEIYKECKFESESKEIYIKINPEKSYDPLTMSIKDNDVILKGLDQEGYRKLYSLYPIAQYDEVSPDTYYKEQYFIFPLNRFPLDKYNFSWDGKQIKINDYVNHWYIHIYFDHDVFKINYPIHNSIEMYEQRNKMGLDSF